MKALVTFAAAAVIFSGINVASAQNAAPTTKVSPSPNSINKGSRPTVPSGSEAKAAASNRPANVAGKGKFCKPTTANGTLNCFYMSMKACEQHNKSNNLRCVENPNSGT
jgi:hypothetical protein